MADILISHLFGTVPEIIEAYFSLPIPILKADFFRYLILLSRGGIYADIDTEALKSAHFSAPSDIPTQHRRPRHRHRSGPHPRRLESVVQSSRPVLSVGDASQGGAPGGAGGGCANYGGDVGEETRGEVGGGVAEREFEYY